MQSIFSDRNQAKVNPLSGMLKTSAGKEVTQKNLHIFIKQKVIPKIKIESKSYKAKDGVERIKVTAAIKMVPRHLEVRAIKYLNDVRTYAKQFNIEPQSIMAVIHAESYFNPLAESPAPAFGLMQLIPRNGDRDAYKFMNLCFNRQEKTYRCR